MKFYPTLFLACFLLSSLLSVGQVGYDTVYTRKLSNLTHTGGNAIVELPGNNLLLSTTYSGGGLYCNTKPRLYTVNNNGDSTWARSGIPGSGPMVKTRDGNFVNANLVHHISNCGYDTIQVCKFNINGDALWTRKFFFGISGNQVEDIIETNDGGFAIAGFYSENYGSGGPWISVIIKLDPAGNTQWVRHFGSTMDQLEVQTIRQTSTGDYGIFCFKPFSGNTPYSSYRMIKMNSIGDTIWTKDLSLNGVAGYGAMDLLPNDEFLCTGATYNASSTKSFMARFNKNGLLTLYKEYPFTQSGLSFIMNEAKYLSNHNAYLIVNDRLLLTDTSGTELWASQIFSNIVFRDVIQTSNNDLVAIGTESSSTNKIFYVRFRDTTKNAFVPDSNRADIKIYPNPTRNDLVIDFNKDYANITVQLFNMLGQRLINGKYYNTRNIHLFLNKLPVAVYVLRIFYDDKKFSTKIMKY